MQYSYFVGINFYLKASQGLYQFFEMPHNNFKKQKKKKKKNSSKGGQWVSWTSPRRRRPTGRSCSKLLGHNRPVGDLTRRSGR